MSSPALQAHLDPAGKVLDDPPHSSLGIALTAAVISALRSGIVWGLLPCTLSLRYPPNKNQGESSPVNAAATVGHTCG